MEIRAVNNYYPHTAFKGTTPDMSGMVERLEKEQNHVNLVYEDKFFSQNSTDSNNSGNNSKNNITFKEFVDRIKINKHLIGPFFTKRGMRALCKDPVAFLFPFARCNYTPILKENIISTADVRKRKEQGTEPCNIKKVTMFPDCYQYSITKKRDNLASLYVYHEDNNVLYIDYATTVNGEKDYRGMLLQLVQAAVEDYIMKNGRIPQIQAEAANIGSKNFNRSTLYKYYGADVSEPKNGLAHCTVNPEKIEKYLKRAYKNNHSILPFAKERFEEITESSI